MPFDAVRSLISNYRRLPRTGWQAISDVDPYTTQLTPNQEAMFQVWAKQNGVRMEPGWNEDYDMRGLWKFNPLTKPDERGHWPDLFKKPNHPTFSRESIYATSDAPRWVGRRLINSKGRIIVEE